MYKKQVNYRKTSLRRNESTEGEPIEIKVERMEQNKEQINNKAPLIYMERKEGINQAYNPRADWQEIAIDATDKIAKSYRNRRDPQMKVEKGGKSEESDKSAGAEPTHGKSQGDTSK